MNDFKSHLLIPLICTVLFFGGLGIYVKEMKKEKAMMPSPTQSQPKPKYKIDWYLKESKDGWNTLVSRRFNFQIIVPEEFAVHEGGSFDRNYPEKETTQISFVSGNFGGAVTVGAKPSEDLKSFVEAEAEKVRTSWSVPPTVSSIRKSKVGNTEGYEYTAQFLDKLEGGTSYNYFTYNDDYYFNIGYFYPSQTANSNYRKDKILEKIINSFQFIAPSN